MAHDPNGYYDSVTGKWRRYDGRTPEGDKERSRQAQADRDKRLRGGLSSTSAEMLRRSGSGIPAQEPPGDHLSSTSRALLGLPAPESKDKPKSKRKGKDNGRS